jgi:hypothetical protein
VRSTTLLFTTLCTSIQNFGENRGQTVAVGMKFCRNETSRQPERRARSRRAVHAVPPTRAPTRAFLRPPRASRPHTARAPSEFAPAACRSSRAPVRRFPPVLTTGCRPMCRARLVVLPSLAHLCVAERALSLYKRGTARQPRVRLPFPARAAPPAPLEAAAVNPRVRPAAYPTEAPSTFSCTCFTSLTRSRFPPSRHLAGAELLAAAAA